MKVCIYGAGAIGGWIGVRLARAGCDVSVVARGATLDALRRHGLRLQQGGEFAVSPRAGQREPGGPGRAGPGRRRRQGPGDGRGRQVHRTADRCEDRRAHGDEWRALVVLRGFRRTLRRHAAGLDRSGRQHCESRAGRAHHRLRRACELLAAGTGLRDASLRQQADHRRAIGRQDAARARAGGAAGAGRLRDGGVGADPERRLVQAVGQHDDEPGERDHRRHHRPRCWTTTWCAASSSA